MKHTANSTLENPLRDIILNRDQLLQHAAEIARFHVQVGISKRQKRMLPRLLENTRFLKQAYSEISDYVRKTGDMVPAAEWFLDNYYLFKDSYQEIRKNLSWRYERQLTRVGGGDFEGYPRIYALMVELVEHTDSGLTEEILIDYINDYQRHVPLTTGELWAIPSVLKIILVENIRRLTEQILRTQRERQAADELIQPIFKSGQLIDGWQQHLKALDERDHFSPEFTERLYQRIREFGMEGIPVLRWLERSVSKHDLDIEKLAKLEHQRQAMCQVSMGHAISSLRFIAEENWALFFEKTSLIEKALAEDPAGVYLEMDFTSRDRYRQEVEKLARRFKVAESVIARKVILKAQEATSLPMNHVGYYLVGKGRELVERELEMEWRDFRKLWCQVRRFICSTPNFVYFGSLSLVSLALFYGLLQWFMQPLMPLNAFCLTGLSLMLVIVVTSLTIPLVNWVISLIIPPAFLPKLEFRQGIPAELRTIVVVPALLSHKERVEELLQQLEIYHLANQDPHLHFALLGDFRDSAQEEEAEDQEIIETACNGVMALNRKYGADRFYFLHRKRQYNQVEGVWMGWERKRGKLIEFNRLVTGSGETSYVYQVGELSLLPQMVYCITLDADTQLPRGSAHRLLGTIAHPLHKPVLNPEKTRVVEGYGVLQPRIAVSYQSTMGSLFARVFAGQAGVDPYTTAVSDLYQDLFGEGIFTGKGIYNIRVFHQVTENQFPENTILSHDLVEGLYARAALVSDIELIDGYPAKYHAYARRSHRWIRGDWQILRWLLKPLPWQSRWKILDNMRRSLEAPSLFVLLIAGLMNYPIWQWIALGFVALFWPSLISLMNALKDRTQGQYLVGTELKNRFLQLIFQFAMLPYQALINLDAITRALYRQFISKRKLLEWETAADTDQRTQVSFKASAKSMWLVWVLVLFLGIVSYNRGILNLTSPVLGLWAISPYLAYYYSRPLKTASHSISDDDKHDLRRWARKIWAFFEEYVHAEENWLPPDNVQIDPPNGVAHRTSPTNIGLSLLANLTAWDLGYITIPVLQQRITGTLDTIDKLEQWKGHLYNWYNTLTLEPLQPLYVSTVDSGNFVVYCLTLEQGLEVMEQSPLLRRDYVEGLQDTLNLITPKTQEGEELVRRFQGDLAGLRADFDLRRWYKFLQSWTEQGRPADKFAAQGAESAYWAKRLEQMLLSFRDEVEKVYPWLVQQEIAEQFLALFSKEKEGQELESYSMSELSALYAEEFYPPEWQDMLTQARHYLGDLLNRSRALRERLRTIAYDTDFKPLFNPERQLFSIGYRPTEGELDKSYYDLMASEARQASFFAIAKGDVPQSHWFRLGRVMTSTHGRRGLVSWSGTMFEFLMPLLVMKTYQNTLLDLTYRTVVDVQRRYGKEKKVPWGISESGFYAFDPQLNYQYKAFGVPGLGLKRGLIQDLVIAPYATFLALMVEPEESLENLRFMSRLGFEDRYGFYEAIDYTSERIPVRENYRIVKSYMAHHQGMSLVTLGNVLLDNIMQARFHRDSCVKATELLLQERIPVNLEVQPQPEEMQKSVSAAYRHNLEENRFITYHTPNTVVPATHLVSNGEYSVMITNSGSGFSRWKNLAVSRWRSDVTMDSWGMYFYIQNLNSGSLWSATYQPTRESGEGYRVTYSPDRVEFQRKDGNIVTKTEVFVSAEDQVEIRRLSLTNQSQHERVLEITSYFEVVLAPQNSDVAHPAFSNLFIQTEFVDNALIASRRPRSDEEPRYFLMHTVAVEGQEVGVIQYETDRSRFIGRGRDLRNPKALELNQPLSNTVGAVLDPIMSLRQRVVIPPGKTARVSFSVGVGTSRDEVLHLAQKYRNPATIKRAFELAWTHSQMELRHLNMGSAQANDALALAGHLLYLSPLRREYSQYINNNIKGQSSLWPYAISGDLPIVLVKVKEAAHLKLVRDLVAMHEYWRLKGLACDLVILNQDESGYVQTFQEMLRDVVTMGQARDLVNKSGGIFVLQQSHLPEDDLNLILTAARVIFSGEEGSLAVQLSRKLKRFSETAKASTVVMKANTSSVALVAENPEVQHSSGDPEISAVVKADGKTAQEKLMFNGIGGFRPDGKEYVIELKPEVQTPLPWLNVIANPRFGFQVTESGGGYTWSQNSRENKLTPWSNDPVMDRPGEVVYLKDSAFNDLWSATPNPLRKDVTYTVRHGQGYSVFEHTYHGIAHETLMFVPMDQPLKVTRLRMKNLSRVSRQLQLTYYVEWVLGVSREDTAPYLVTEYDKDLQVLSARNVYQEEFANRLAFIAAAGADISGYSGDRSAVLGRNSDLKHPSGLAASRLEGSTGAGLDPCGAIQIEVSLDPLQELEVVFVLGEAESREQLKVLLEAIRAPQAVDHAFREVSKFWDDFLSTLQICTPDDSMDLLVNRWLLYQTLVCRIWARSAFYQSGGAYGFRDQLQDVMALIIAHPALTKEQILKHCAHQFVEGDVQHWWHPERGKGIRTKFSDDLLWLPYVTLDYLEHTGDFSILDIEIPYLEDEPLGDEEDERYSIPRISKVQGSVYEHCIKAIERSLKFGEHGLPLIGTGDWNDGFSRIGRKGRGESVWLGWFLLTILKRFANLCQVRGDQERAARYTELAQVLNQNMEKHAWDGGWYRRAYFDDGTPLGSNQNRECQIDAIAQSWSVISGGARPSRAEDAMLALEHYLLKREDGMLLLLTPPFDEFEPDPGYIKGYVPGVRENGGQYTHGAIWAILAFAIMGKGEKAVELFHMLNPINHTRTSTEVARYKTEPYVMAADVYAKTPHVGRGGWTWYTGAAGWMYQAAVEGILGFKLQGDCLELSPCIPKEWKEYTIYYRYKSTPYTIRVFNPHGRNTGTSSIQPDSEVIEGGKIKLIDDGRPHEITVVM